MGKMTTEERIENEKRILRKLVEVMGECGIAWTFTEGGITENGINFCTKCGRRVVT